MAAFGRVASASLAIFLFLFSLSEAREFTLGGNDKTWNESNQALLHDWAGRNRFQVDDKLRFTGPVVQVGSQQEYNSCNSSSPSATYQSGDTAILNRPGYFYFVSQNQSSCYNGQKVIVLVMTPRNNKPSSKSNPPAYSPASAPSPASEAAGKGVTPETGAGAPAVAPTSGAGGLRVGGLVFGLGVLVWSLF